MSEKNKAICRRWVEDGVSKNNLDMIDELFADGYSWHGPGQDIAGSSQFKQFVHAYLHAFPDLAFCIEDLVAEGDRVTARWSAQGTHQGEFAGIAPTGKPVTMTGITIMRIADEKIAEEWESFDELGLMRQLGAIPA